MPVFFCQFPKTLPKAKLKSSELMSMVKKNLRQPNIDSVAWLLGISDRQVYNEKAGRAKKI